MDEGRLAAICSRYGIARLMIFGSVARGTAGPSIDVDILYDLLPGRRLGWEIEDLTPSFPSCSGAGSTCCRQRRCTSVCAQLSWRKLDRCMQRDVLLPEQMIEAADQAVALVKRRRSTGSGSRSDPPRRFAVELHRPGRGFSPAVG